MSRLGQFVNKKKIVNPVDNYTELVQTNPPSYAKSLSPTTLPILETTSKIKKTTKPSISRTDWTESRISVFLPAYSDDVIREKLKLGSSIRL